MDPYTYFEFAELRGRELQRQAERHNLVAAWASTSTRAQPKALDGVRKRLAAFLRRRRSGEQPQLLGG